MATSQNTVIILDEYNPERETPYSPSEPYYDSQITLVESNDEADWTNPLAEAVSVDAYEEFLQNIASTQSRRNYPQIAQGYVQGIITLKPELNIENVVDEYFEMVLQDLKDRRELILMDRQVKSVPFWNDNE